MSNRQEIPVQTQNPLEGLAHLDWECLEKIRIHEET